MERVSVEKVLEIRNVSSNYEGPPDMQVVIVKDGEYPLPANHNIKPGMKIKIIPHTETNSKSGGSITKFEINPFKN